MAARSPLPMCRYCAVSGGKRTELGGIRWSRTGSTFAHGSEPMQGKIAFRIEVSETSSRGFESSTGRTSTRGCPRPLPWPVLRATDAPPSRLTCRSGSGTGRHTPSADSPTERNGDARHAICSAGPHGTSGIQGSANHPPTVRRAHERAFAHDDAALVDVVHRTPCCADARDRLCPARHDHQHPMIDMLPT